jgi:hypothetical protein
MSVFVEVLAWVILVYAAGPIVITVREEMLDGFFGGWPRRPSPGPHPAVLRGNL